MDRSLFVVSKCKQKVKALGYRGRTKGPETLMDFCFFETDLDRLLGISTTFQDGGKGSHQSSFS